MSGSTDNTRGNDFRVIAIIPDRMIANAGKVVAPDA
jgi:hypothetical protein